MYQHSASFGKTYHQKAIGQYQPIKRKLSDIVKYQSYQKNQSIIYGCHYNNNLLYLKYFPTIENYYLKYKVVNEPISASLLELVSSKVDEKKIIADIGKEFWIPRLPSKYYFNASRIYIESKQDSESDFYQLLSENIGKETLKDNNNNNNTNTISKPVVAILDLLSGIGAGYSLCFIISTFVNIIV